MGPIPTAVQKGYFMIANPEIESSLFFRSVLLICEHNASGSFALLINKPLDLQLPEEIVNLSSSLNKRISLRAGGPVQTNQMMLLHSVKDEKQQVLKITDEIFLGGDLQFLHELLDDEASPPVYLCFGYAGWAAGQLEREVLDGSWYLCKATKESLFNIPPERLWRDLLVKMGGKYATLASIPEDLSVN